MSFIATPQTMHFAEPLPLQRFQGLLGLDGALAQHEGGGERQRRQQGEREQHQTEAVGQALLLGAAALGFAAAKQNDGAHGAGLACQVTG